MKFSFILLLCVSVFFMLWCGQDGERDRGGPEADASRVEEPVKASDDAGSTSTIEETGTVPSADGGPDDARDTAADAEAQQAEPGADDGGPSDVDGSPSKTEPTPATPTDAGSTKAPSEKAKTVDAAPSSPDEPNTTLDPETQTLTALLQKVYRDVDSFEADFEQTYRNRLLDRNRETKGHVWLRPPSKMRWEYAPPSKNLIVADGRTLFVYEPEPNQVVKMPVSGSELPSVMAFLTGGRNLSVDYDVREVHREQLTPRGQAGLELRPKAPSSVISRVVLVISRQTGKVQRTVLVEPEGNTNTFVWSKVKTNVTIPNRQFTFTPPAGVRVVER
jgi:outer membrane lipoprotein carrier protein